MPEPENKYSLADFNKYLSDNEEKVVYGGSEMTYKPIHIANTFLERAAKENIPVDHLKIQKLVYCMHGWNLAVNGEPLIDELYEAWPYGPVLATIYNKFKSFGKKNITEYGKDINPQNGVLVAMKVSEANKQFYDLFNVVWNRYKNYSGLQLSDMTHEEGTPWSVARIKCDNYLSNDEVKDHFIGLVK